MSNVCGLGREPTWRVQKKRMRDWADDDGSMGIYGEVPGERHRSVLDSHRDSAALVEESGLLPLSAQRVNASVRICQ